MVRRPAVAGMFYPGNKSDLEKDIAEMIPQSEKKKALGLISPHAGYVYSGKCAGHGFSKIEVPDTVIILGVNHRGIGKPYAVDGHDFWNTPLGDIAIDANIRKQLLANSQVFAIDTMASIQEHSLEVQLPFIQYINLKAKILPITISSMDLDQLLTGGKEIGELIKTEPNLLMVASTDMSHYVSAEEAKIKDQKAIDAIMNLDPEKLFRTVISEQISMCGMAPTVMMLHAALEAGASKAELVQYTHSGETSGDYNQVVAYLSVIVH